MGSLGSFTRAVSGLMASQNGLQTTAHNISNINTEGYTRQRVNTKDSFYTNIGSNCQVGNGVDVSEIQQIRDIFLDRAYRDEASRKSFYYAQQNGIEEIESIFGEQVGGASFADVINEFWDSLNELSKHPEGLEARGMFIQNASLFVDKANYIHKQLQEYQNNLNGKIKDLVYEVNGLADKISELNSKIASCEISGDNANDYRDRRNNYLDRLSQIADIKYREDASGMVTVKIEGNSLVTGLDTNKIAIENVDADSPFIKPVWERTHSDVFKDKNEEVNSINNNDKGELKGLLLLRGDFVADYTYMQDTNKYDSIKNSVVMKAQAKFDQLVHHVVTMVNDKISPYDKSTGKKDMTNAPMGLDGTTHLELFKRKDMDRFDASDNYNAEDPNNKNSLYSSGNLEINYELINNKGKLALSLNNEDIAENNIVKDIMEEWKNPTLKIDNDLEYEYYVDDYYAALTADIAKEGEHASSKVDNQTFMVNQINNQKSSISGVSSEDELSSMMKYQHAYNASARVVNVLDEMIKQIILNMGVVGR